MFCVLFVDGDEKPWKTFGKLVLPIASLNFEHLYLKKIHSCCFVCFICRNLAVARTSAPSHQLSQINLVPSRVTVLPTGTPIEQSKAGLVDGGNICRCFVNYLPLNSARCFILCANQTLMIKIFLSVLRFLYENILICNVLFTQTMSKIFWREANIFRKSSSQ